MRMGRAVLVVFLLLVVPLLPALDKKGNSGQVSTISFTVLKDDNGKPIRNAAVVLHPVGEHGKASRRGLELKTDLEGKTSMDGIPYGRMLIQVIAPGFQTYGQDYTIDQPTQDLTIRLKRPQQQYSIYEKHPSESESSSGGNNNSPPPK